MPRYTVEIDGERHAFAHVIAERISRDHAPSFCTFQVPDPLKDVAYVVLDAPGREEAVRLVGEACAALVADIDAILHDLGLETTLPTETARHINLPNSSISESS
tara:strand:+ start:3091 stop:3402 length:312 start_codon:yes stop_codon:yes gene_type:complete